MKLLSTAAEALEFLPPAPKIALHSACAEPQTLLDTLMTALKNGNKKLAGATIYALTYRASDAPTPLYGDTELLSTGKLHLKSFFPHPSLREVSRHGLVDYVPASFSTLPGLIRRGLLPLDAAFLQITPPGPDGLCSLGPSADYAESLLETVPVLIGEMNRQMPFVGGPRVSPDRFTAFIESDRPLLEVPPLTVGENERKVAENVVEFIKDGSTVQLGVGTVPEEVARLLKYRRNLNLHGGAITDPIVELMQSGAITNHSKPFDRGKSVTALLIGTKHLFDYANNNPEIELQGIDRVNDPFRVAQMPGFVSVNSAVEIDYWGQVNAEMVGDWQLAGVGGQLDYIMGAWYGQDAISIIALPSVTPKGHPRIVSHLKAASPVSTPRHAAQVVITEKGVADLRGKSLSERKRLLTAISE